VALGHNILSGFSQVL